MDVNLGYRTLIAAAIGFGAFVVAGLFGFLVRRPLWVLPTVAGLGSAVAAWLYDWWTERGGG